MATEKQYGTPNSDIPPVLECHSLVIPQALRPQIFGAIASLFKTENWYEDGDMPIDDAIQLCLDMFAKIERRCGVIIGEIITVAINEADLPEHLLPCDGAWHEKTEYPDLYDAVASQFKNASQVKTPDLRARVVAGVGTDGTLASVAMNGKFGTEFINVTPSWMPNHNHSLNQYSTILMLAGELAPIQVATVPKIFQPTTSTGGGLANDKFQPSLGLQYAIVAKYPEG